MTSVMLSVLSGWRMSVETSEEFGIVHIRVILDCKRLEIYARLDIPMHCRCMLYTAVHERSASDLRCQRPAQSILNGQFMLVCNDIMR